MTKPKPRPGYSLSREDYEIMRFLEQHRFATIAQAARWRQTSMQAAWHRFKRLTALGYVEGRDIGEADWHRIYFLTEAAHRRINSDYRHAVTPTLTRIKHDLACTDTAVAYRQANPDALIVSERQVSRDLYIARRGWDDGVQGMWMVHQDDQGGTHSPDLIIVTEEPVYPDDPEFGTRKMLHCIEVELTVKDDVRQKRVLRSMMSDDRVASLTYFTPSVRQRDRLTAIFEGLKAEYPERQFDSEWFQVYKYVPMHSAKVEPQGDAKARTPAEAS